MDSFRDVDQHDIFGTAERNRDPVGVEARERVCENGVRGGFGAILEGGCFDRPGGHVELDQLK